MIALAVVGLLPLRDDVHTATAALVLVLPGVVTALSGSRSAATTSAVVAATAFNVGFLEPYGTLKLDGVEEAVDLAVFVGVALTTATLVAREAARRQAAERRREEVEALDRENVAMRAERERLAAEALALGLAGEHRAALLRAVSHDLRTPLATIRAVSSDLRDGADYDDDTRNELLDLVVDEAERLDRLVANLLSLSRVEAGALVPVPQAVALEELFEQCVRRHARLVRGQRLSIEVPLTLPLVHADYTLVEQALTNLLANAVRHAPPDSRILLSARTLGDEVEVAVTDQGTGIAPEERDVVFTPFRSGPGSTSSGIGLAIVRAIAEAHGGTVRIDDNPRGGAVVAFTLPVRG